MSDTNLSGNIFTLSIETLFYFCSSQLFLRKRRCKITQYSLIVACLKTKANLLRQINKVEDKKNIS